MTKAQRLPLSCPGIGINGENANESALGAMVFLMRLATPNTPPKNAPLRGPSKTAPITTGTCSMVALMNGRSISPSGVKASTKITEVNMAKMASPCTLCLFADERLEFFNFLTSGCCSFSLQGCRFALRRGICRQVAAALQYRQPFFIKRYSAQNNWLMLCFLRLLPSPFGRCNDTDRTFARLIILELPDKYNGKLFTPPLLFAILRGKQMKRG